MIQPYVYTYVHVCNLYLWVTLPLWYATVPGTVSSSSHDGTRLCHDSRDHVVLVWLQRCQEACRENCHHLQAVVRTAQLSGVYTYA